MAQPRCRSMSASMERVRGRCGSRGWDMSVGSGHVDIVSAAELRRVAALLLAQADALDETGAQPEPEREPALVPIAIIVARFGVTADAVRKAAKRRKLGASRRGDG